ncbi:hypothetical protein FACS189481_5480 [Clostridia bacterium]|nr:hypothetical protein FACS189481_5480 [Clostridia bacterium]
MFEKLKEILEPLKIYNLEEKLLVVGELKVYDDMAVKIFNQLGLDDEKFWQKQWKSFAKESKTFDEIETTEDVWSEF